MAVDEWYREDYLISTRPELLMMEAVIAALGETYWAGRTAPEDLTVSIENSTVFGLYRLDEEGDVVEQIGFARAVTDKVRFGWLSDVYVLEAFQGQGLGAWLLTCVVAKSHLAKVKKWLLATDDAFEYYEKEDFRRLTAEDGYMSRGLFDIKGEDNA